MKSICVYTCITGDYDEVKELSFREENIDYYLFTNNKNITSNTWKVVYIENDGLDNIRLARKIKVLGHDILKKYDITVWMDGASYIRKSIFAFISEYCDFDKYSLVGFKHRERECIYDEALECVRVRKEKKDIIQKQMKRYNEENYPAHFGLIESTVLFRKNHDEKLKIVMEKWFNEICLYSYRDQLSFNYVAWKEKLNYFLIDMNVFDNEYFGWVKHTSKKVLGDYSVYFGGDSDFSYDSLLLGSFQRKSNTYVAKFKCMKNCHEFKIEFAHFPGILFSNLDVKGKNIHQQNLVNYNQYFEYSIFDNQVPTLFIYGDFKKGQVFEISIDMEILSDEFYLDLLKRFNISLIQVINESRKEKKLNKFIKKIKVAMKR